MATVQSIRTAVLGRRRELGLSQAQLAERAGVSRKWLSEFERGKSTAELGLVLRLLDELDLTVTVSKAETASTTADPGPTAPVDLDELLAEYRDAQ
jgi:HTH-type transcriptional regulator / antitoxin HipB